MNKKLNTKFWNSDNTLKKDVRKPLLKIANDFVKFLKIKNLKISDIVFTGSLANYTWHSKSDLDVHIVVDLSNFSNNTAFIEEYLSAKKTVWNTLHSIQIHGYVVEVYPEKKGSNSYNTGIYSIAKDKWVVTPPEVDTDIDEDAINSKFEYFKNLIMDLEERGSKCKQSECGKLILQIEKLMEKLKAKRTVGLKELGEKATDNQVYKKLRKAGLIEKLYQMKFKIYDSEVTLENIYKNSDLKCVFEIGDKYLLNKSVGSLHSHENDRIRVFNILENVIHYRNIRTRKEYTINTAELQKFAEKKFIKLIK